MTISRKSLSFQGQNIWTKNLVPMNIEAFARSLVVLLLLLVLVVLIEISNTTILVMVVQQVVMILIYILVLASNCLL